MLTCEKIYRWFFGAIITIAPIQAVSQTISQPSGCPLTGCTFSAPGAPTTFVINPSSVTETGTFLVTIGGVSGYDYSNGPSPASRWLFWNTTISPSVDTHNIWENFPVFVTLNGPGRAQAEINVVNSYFQANAGSISTSTIEMNETSALNNGSLAFIANYLALFTNGTTGTIANQIQGIKFSLVNNNTTAGSITTYTAIDMEAMVGPGSLPTNYFLIRNVEPNAYIATLGHVNIGIQGDNGANLYVQGPDTSGTTFPFIIRNSALANLFFVGDDGRVTVPSNALEVGTVGSVFGRIFFANTTSGTVQLNAPATGALGASVATLPINTGTIAELNLQQNWTAAQAFTTDVTIGVAGDAGFPLYVQGPDTSGSTSAFVVRNSTPSNIFFVTDNGTVVVPANALTLGTAGSVLGRILFTNATSGSIQLNAPSGVVLSGTITIPNNTGTLAELNLAQTWTGIQTFSNGFTGTCGPVPTIVVAGGIITSC